MIKILPTEWFEILYDDGKCPYFHTSGLSTTLLDLKVLRALCLHSQAKNVLEFGVRFGHTANFLLSQSSYIQKYIGIDVPPDFKTTKQSQQSEVPNVIGSVCKDHRYQSVILKNGTKDLEENPFIFGCSFDFIFVDADHSMDGISRDTKIAEKLINPNGIIVWHDFSNEEDVTSFLNNKSLSDDKITYVVNSLCCFKHY